MDAAGTSTNPRTLPADAALEVLESLPGGVLLVAPDLTVCYRTAAAGTCLAPGDDLPTIFAGARFLDPFDGWPSEIARLLASGASARFACALPGGTTGQGLIILDCAPWRTREGGAVHGIVVHLEDGSKWVGLEQRLAVAERLAAVGKLAAKVAHELNNPLDGILRYVNLALRLVGDAPEPKLRAYLDESRTGLMRMVQIIGELLEFSRSTQGEFDVLPVNEVVVQALNSLGPAAEARNIVVAADFQQQHLPGIRGGRLLQVCCNLIKNAIDAMPQGGRLTVTTGIVQEQVVIRVADTGVGLPNPPERVFEPFFTTKPPGQGTGLGLAICRDYITGMQGTIDAAGGEQGGAVFTVRIPVAACQAVPSRTQSAGAHAPSTGTPPTMRADRACAPTAPCETG
ncbi:MAG TPA: ATP-binding protein [Phycisphaerae bacterium]|nr:ATP-binding protein [Phycisphaerae bacterium]HNU44627.1 ATP-binding protein [Phycisphaerae bacterium]